MRLVTAIESIREPMEGLSVGIGIVGAWTARNWRHGAGTDDADLQAQAWQLIRDLEAMASGPFPLTLDFEIFPEGERAPRTEEEFKAGLDAVLETARAAHSTFSGTGFKLLCRSVAAVDPKLAERLKSASVAALARIREFEKALIFFGAGRDDEADLAADLVPEPVWEAGPSV